MASLLQRYLAWSAEKEEWILTLADPSMQWKRHPMADAPFANFATVYAVLVAYLSFVIIGTVRLLFPFCMLQYHLVR